MSDILAGLAGEVNPIGSSSLNRSQWAKVRQWTEVREGRARKRLRPKERRAASEVDVIDAIERTVLGDD